MARSFNIVGETLVFVEGNGQFLSSGTTSEDPVLYELGLCRDDILIRPRFFHQDIRIDSFGTRIPSEIMSDIMDVEIQMNLIHFDTDVLYRCFSNSMGGSDFINTGKLSAAGTLMNNMIPVGCSGNHYISLYLVPGRDSGNNVRFLQTMISQPYLTEQPLGTTTQTIKTVWRAVPYKDYLSGLTKLYNDNPLFNDSFDQILKNFITSGRLTYGMTSKDSVVWDYNLPPNYRYNPVTGELITPS